MESASAHDARGKLAEDAATLYKKRHADAPPVDAAVFLDLCAGSHEVHELASLDTRLAALCDSAAAAGAHAFGGDVTDIKKHSIRYGMIPAEDTEVAEEKAPTKRDVCEILVEQLVQKGHSLEDDTEELVKELEECGLDASFLTKADAKGRDSDEEGKGEGEDTEDDEAPPHLILRAMVAVWLKKNVRATHEGTPLTSYSKLEPAEILTPGVEHETLAGAHWLILIATAHRFKVPIAWFSSVIGFAVAIVPPNTPTSVLGNVCTTEESHVTSGLPGWVRVCQYARDLFGGLSPAYGTEAYELIEMISQRGKAFDQGQSALSRRQNSSGGAAMLDAVLLVGTTGAGKSTTLNFLSGATMVKEGRHVRVKQNGIEGCKIGHGHDSMTKVVLMYPIRDPTTGQEMVFVDTPGTEDSSGAFEDIVNAVVLLQFISRCDKVRLAQLVPASTVMMGGSRSDLATQLARMNRFWRDGVSSGTERPKLMNHVVFWVTKAEEDLKEKEVVESIQKLSKTRGDNMRADRAAAKNVLDAKTQKGKKPISIVRPLEGESHKKELLQMVSDTVPITEPLKFLKVALTDAGRLTLNEIVRCIRDAATGDFLMPNGNVKELVANEVAPSIANFQGLTTCLIIVERIFNLLQGLDDSLAREVRDDYEGAIKFAVRHINAQVTELAEPLFTTFQSDVGVPAREQLVSFKLVADRLSSNTPYLIAPSHDTKPPGVPYFKWHADQSNAAETLMYRDTLVDKLRSLAMATSGNALRVIEEHGLASAKGHTAASNALRKLRSLEYLACGPLQSVHEELQATILEKMKALFDDKVRPNLQDAATMVDGVRQFALFCEASVSMLPSDNKPDEALIGWGVEFEKLKEEVRKQLYEPCEELDELVKGQTDKLRRDPNEILEGISKPVKKQLEELLSKVERLLTISRLDGSLVAHLGAPADAGSTDNGNGNGQSHGLQQRIEESITSVTSWHRLLADKVREFVDGALELDGALKLKVVGVEEEASNGEEASEQKRIVDCLRRVNCAQGGLEALCCIADNEVMDTKEGKPCQRAHRALIDHIMKTVRTVIQLAQTMIVRDTSASQGGTFDVHQKNYLLLNQTLWWDAVSGDNDDMVKQAMDKMSELCVDRAKKLQRDGLAELKMDNFEQAFEHLGAYFDMERFWDKSTLDANVSKSVRDSLDELDQLCSETKTKIHAFRQEKENCVRFPEGGEPLPKDDLRQIEDFFALEQLLATPLIKGDSKSSIAEKCGGAIATDKWRKQLKKLHSETEKNAGDMFFCLIQCVKSGGGSDGVQKVEAAGRKASELSACFDFLEDLQDFPLIKAALLRETNNKFNPRSWCTKRLVELEDTLTSGFLRVSAEAQTAVIDCLERFAYEVENEERKIGNPHQTFSKLSQKLSADMEKMMANAKSEVAAKFVAGTFNQDTYNGMNRLKDSSNPNNPEGDQFIAMQELLQETLEEHIDAARRLVLNLPMQFKREEEFMREEILSRAIKAWKTVRSAIQPGRNHQEFLQVSDEDASMRLKVEEELNQIVEKFGAKFLEALDRYVKKEDNVAEAMKVKASLADLARMLGDSTALKEHVARLKEVTTRALEELDTHLNSQFGDSKLPGDVSEMSSSQMAEVVTKIGQLHSIPEKEEYMVQTLKTLTAKAKAYMEHQLLFVDDPEQWRNYYRARNMPVPPMNPDALYKMLLKIVNREEQAYKDAQLHELYNEIDHAMSKLTKQMQLRAMDTQDFDQKKSHQQAELIRDAPTDDDRRQLEKRMIAAHEKLARDFEKELKRDPMDGEECAGKWRDLDAYTRAETVELLGQAKSTIFATLQQRNNKVNESLEKHAEEVALSVCGVLTKAQSAFQRRALEPSRKEGERLKQLAILIECMPVRIKNNVLDPITRGLKEVEALFKVQVSTMSPADWEKLHQLLQWTDMWKSEEGIFPHLWTLMQSQPRKTTFAAPEPAEREPPPVFAMQMPYQLMGGVTLGGEESIPENEPAPAPAPAEEAPIEPESVEPSIQPVKQGKLEKKAGSSSYESCEFMLAGMSLIETPLTGAGSTRSRKKGLEPVEYGLSNIERTPTEEGVQYGVSQIKRAGQKTPEFTIKFRRQDGFSKRQIFSKAAKSITLRANTVEEATEWVECIERACFGTAIASVHHQLKASKVIERRFGGGGILGRLRSRKEKEERARREQEEREEKERREKEQREKQMEEDMKAKQQKYEQKAKMHEKFPKPRSQSEEYVQQSVFDDVVKEELRTTLHMLQNGTNGTVGALLDSAVNAALEEVRREFKIGLSQPMDVQVIQLVLNQEVNDLLRSSAFDGSQYKRKVEEVQTALKDEAEKRKAEFDEAIRLNEMKRVNLAQAAIQNMSEVVMQCRAFLPAGTDVPNAKECTAAVQEKLREAKDKVHTLAKGKGDVDQLASDLCIAVLRLKFMGSEISYVKDEIERCIEDALANFRDRHKSAGIGKLANMFRNAHHERLTSSDGSSSTVIDAKKVEQMARLILDQAKVFMAQQIEKMNTRTQGMTLEQVKKRLETEVLQSGSKPRKIIDEEPGLFEAHVEFDSYYEQFLKMAFRPGARDLRGDLVGHARKLAASPPERMRFGDGLSVPPGTDLFRNFYRFVGMDESAEQMTKQSDRTVALVAIVTAWWTITFFHESGMSDESDQPCARKPHLVQILCILRLLGATPKAQDEKTASGATLDNQLAQVSTGEGKSVVLAVTATVLALYGLHVDCVCYSAHLSQRDEKAFEDMFRSFQVRDRIRYGTFQELANNLLTEAHGDIRETVHGYLKGETVAPKVPKSAKRVLLIDEVDVFLDESVMGSPYRPTFQLHTPQIAQLMRLLYKSPKASLRDIKNGSAGPLSAAYDSVFDGLKALNRGAAEWFVDSAVVQMQSCIQSMQKQKHDSDQYMMRGGWISYKVQDSYFRSDQVSLGYATNYAYLREFEADPDHNKISEEDLIEHGLPLHAVCGEFSYALLPTTKADPARPDVPGFYKCILGVSGTLKKGKLPDEDRALLQDHFKIKKFTYCPSIYGGGDDSAATEFGNVDFFKGKDVKWRTSDQFFSAVSDEIRTRVVPVKGKIEDIARCVIVFFDSIETISDFLRSPEYAELDKFAKQTLKMPIELLTERLEKQQRDTCIENATVQGQITLATRSFGRGIDFKVRDDELAKKDGAGGLHVICAFFPSELSEEVQIRGRTARQGDPGSFSMVLKADDLLTLGTNAVTQDLLDTWQSNQAVYSHLSMIRAKMAETAKEGMKLKANEAMDDHQKTAAALSEFQRGSREAVSKLLKKLNKVSTSSSVAKATRTLFLIDLTNSMGTMLRAVKQTVNKFFGRVNDILDRNQLEAAFEIQIGFYRNYNSPMDQIFVASNWEMKTEPLSEFLKTNNVSGGYGEEAVEVGLWHALQLVQAEGTFSQIILIGDAPANSMEDIQRKRGISGPNYNTKTAVGQTNWRFPNGIPVDVARNHAAQLAAHGIPIHSFYINGRAASSFAELSQITGGKCEALDINSAKGAELLAGIVCTSILANIDTDLVAEYNDTYTPVLTFAK